MLTICLVTQGRTEVSQFLASTSRLHDLDFINFLIIDNGAPPEVSSVIQAWSEKRIRVTYIRRDENTIDFNDIWPLVNVHASEWINFPGDDDRLVFEGYLEWERITSADGDLNVVAMSAKVIDVSGGSTSETVGPTISKEYAPSEQLALALHSPPFFWPALFFRKSSLTAPFPRSRFVLDWLISLQLITKGQIQISNEYSLEYKRHENQESNQVSLNRKYFEAAYRIEEFISGESFNRWLFSLNDEEKLMLWNTTFLHPPIYGDSDFGNIVLFRLARSLVSSTQSIALQNRIISDLSFKLGTLHHDKSIGEILDIDQLDRTIRGNIHIANPIEFCPILRPLSGAFIGNSNSVSIIIGCTHQRGKSGAIRIKCEEYLDLAEAQMCDKLVQDINSFLELKGVLGFRISPRERLLLVFMRRVKPMAPKRLIMWLRKLK